MLVYKFRAAEQIQFAFDIILNRRLYCAEWRTLNDPMEGVFRYTSYFDAEDFERQVEGIRTHQRTLRVCSLTEHYRSHLLWSHYAGGHSGVAIEIRLPDDRDPALRVRYANESPLLDRGAELHTENMAKALLGWKHSEWAYERELRIVQPDLYYGPVEVTRVIIGMRMHEALREAVEIVCKDQGIETTRTLVV